MNGPTMIGILAANKVNNLLEKAPNRSKKTDEIYSKAVQERTAYGEKSMKDRLKEPHDLSDLKQVISGPFSREKEGSSPTTTASLSDGSREVSPCQSPTPEGQRDWAKNTLRKLIDETRPILTRTDIAIRAKRMPLLRALHKASEEDQDTVNRNYPDEGTRAQLFDEIFTEREAAAKLSLQQAREQEKEWNWMFLNRDATRR